MDKHTRQRLLAKSAALAAAREEHSRRMRDEPVVEETFEECAARMRAAGAGMTGRTGTDPAVSEAHARVLLRERWPHAEIEWLAACDRDRPPLFDVTEEC